MVSLLNFIIECCQSIQRHELPVFTQKQKMEASENWCQRRILRISWTYHTMDNDALERLKKEKDLINNIKERKIKYFGHLKSNQKYKIA